MVSIFREFISTKRSIVSKTTNNFFIDHAGIGQKMKKVVTLLMTSRLVGKLIKNKKTCAF